MAVDQFWDNGRASRLKCPQVNNCPFRRRVINLSVYRIYEGRDISSQHPNKSDGPANHGQRISICLTCKDFCQELGVHQATYHLAPETVFDGMTFEEGDGEAA